MPLRSLIQPPAPPRQRPANRARVPVVGALVALVWLTVAVLPATRPNQGSGTYFGAALIAVVAGAGVVMLVGLLRQRAAQAAATLADAVAPILAMAIGSLVLGGLAYALKDASPVLQDAFTWAAELGGLAMLVSLIPLPASDGARAIRIVLAQTRTSEEVEAVMARTVKAAGVAVIVVALCVAAFLDLGLGILGIGLGWITLASSRVTRAQQGLDTTLQNLSTGHVMQRAEPIPGWRTLSEVLREQPDGWPIGVSAVPVVDWSGAPAGVLATAGAERALAADKGDERVSTLAVPAALVPSVDVDSPASALVQLLAGTAAGMAIVTRDGHPIGTVSSADLQKVVRTSRLRASARTRTGS